MIVLKDIKQVYLLGIGGIGMSALARYFNALGKQVSGYDKTPTRLTSDLLAEGIAIHFEDDVASIPAAIREADQKEVLIIYTSAIPTGHQEFNYFIEHQFVVKKRAEVLGLITNLSKTVAVAGTHGKTTTSSLIAHILKVGQLDPSAFLGGITQNYNTNLLLSAALHSSSFRLEDSIVVVEADEYDRSFLTLHPKIAVITSVDADHLDIYGDKKYVEESYALFARQVQDQLIIKNTIAEKLSSTTPTLTYSLKDQTADYYAKNISIKEARYFYDVVTPDGVIEKLTLGLAGLHNVENSIAAVAVASMMGVAPDDIRNALQSFIGTRRRFDYQIKTDALVFIDDYAHHPEELKAFIGSVRALYPTQKLTGIFQPHLFSRTRDFADEFATSLDLLDECVLLEVYPAREQPIEGVNSKMLLDKMKISNKLICQKNDLIDTVSKYKLEVILTMGAGDIDTLVEPLKNKLLELNEISV